MKNIILAFVCILLVKTASAQKDSLAFDENNKYIYYQTVEKAGLSKDTLYKRALYFSKTAFPQGKFKLSLADGNQGVIAGNSAFMVSKKLLIAAKEDGQIAYTLRIEVKDAKYRYWFTNFIYTPFQRDRFGVSVPIPGKDVTLEQANDKMDKKDVAVYLDKILQNSRQAGAVLKAYMLKTSSIPQANKKINRISTKEW